MGNLREIAGIVIYSGAMFAFIMAAEQLVSPKRNIINVIGFAGLFCNAVFNLNIGFAADGVHLQYPSASFFFVTSLFLAGPLSYLYYKSILEDNFIRPGENIHHFILPSAILICEIYFQTIPYEEQQSFISAAFNPSEISIIKTGIICGVLSVILYHTYMVKKIFIVWGNKNIRPGPAIVILLNLAGVASSIFLLSGFLAGSRGLLVLGGLMFVALNVMIFLSHSRHPEFFYLLKKEIRDTRYRKSMLTGIDVDILHRQLLSLMADGLYRDYNLTLPILSDKLEISAHRLSQFLNERLRTNFKNFVNTYRIEEAKSILQSEPGLNILSVCFHVGFNSKSAFNAAFKKITGSVPRNFKF